MKRIWFMVLGVGLSVALAAGCVSIARLDDAEARFAEAKRLGAEEKAPFEYYAAEAYLDWARHERGEGDRKYTNVFSEESIKYAEQAIGKSGGDK